ncbi:hypothetical protein E2C01_028821 [Portunus trituberculatus]|uniref:Uncharacterized protein n=1 Tax=Portunus trituberculatus TaxID=210409 RepID=A0A5B7EQI7_PORTR|nr:hypothetical protein [Portunus trituberculatus]
MGVLTSHPAASSPTTILSFLMSPHGEMTPWETSARKTLSLMVGRKVNARKAYEVCPYLDPPSSSPGGIRKPVRVSREDRSLIW